MAYLIVTVSFVFNFEYYLCTGKILLDGLKSLCRDFPDQIANARGRGTFCAFDCTSMAARDNMVEVLKTQGNFFIVLSPWLSVISRKFFLRIVVRSQLLEDSRNKESSLTILAKIRYL